MANFIVKERIETSAREIGGEEGEEEEVLLFARVFIGDSARCCRI